MITNTVCIQFIGRIPAKSDPDAREKNDMPSRVIYWGIRIIQLTKSPRREHITPVLKAYIGSKFRIESHIKY